MRDYLLEPEETGMTYPSIRQIQLEVCEKYGIDIREMVSERRSRRLTVPRHEACYRAYKETIASLPVIGRAFHRDHTSILWAVRRHQERMEIENDAASKSMDADVLGGLSGGHAQADDIGTRSIHASHS